MDLNELIDRTHFDYEQNETKAKQLEDRILKVPGMSKSYLPAFAYSRLNTYFSPSSSLSSSSSLKEAIKT